MVWVTTLLNKGSLSEVYDAAFAWLEHKDLRTPSRDFRMLLQSYRTSNASMTHSPPKKKDIDRPFFQIFQCMPLSRHFTTCLFDVSKAA